MPTKPVEVQISSWQDYIRFTSEMNIGSPLGPTYVFRGQTNASWSLLPTLARIALKEGLDASRTIKIETTAWTKFRELAHLYLPPSSIPHEGDLIAWWILMQHYGVPTRVLDWTESPFVALYFAVQEQVEEPGAVWTLHPATLHEFSFQADNEYKFPKTVVDVKRYQDPLAKPFLHVVTRKTLTDRMSAQQMQTTIGTQPLMDHATTIANVLPHRPGFEQFSKLIIPPSLKGEFMRQLRTMNVTAGALFPGIEGLGRSVSELMKLTCRYEASKSIEEKK